MRFSVGQGPLKVEIASFVVARVVSWHFGVWT